MNEQPGNVTVLILATSLDPESRSSLLAREAHRQLGARGIAARWIDLRELSVPIYPGDGEENEAVATLKAAVGQATHLLFAVPVYNWDVNAAAKNVIEWLSTHELGGKTVGFLCAAGGPSSYMSVLSFANSLMLDFRCWIVPRFVYAVGSDFSGDGIGNPQVIERIERLTVEMFR
ncbi:MAG: NADPH-dependent FMN reductase [Capsulimonadales bacterium]|nr:NADPH-dependent FMN reductase [Capsulimonadales bacterium]